MTPEVFKSLKEILRGMQQKCFARFRHRAYKYTCRFCGANADTASAFIHANYCECVRAEALIRELEDAMKGK